MHQKEILRICFLSDFICYSLAIGTAETPAEPMRGLILSLLKRFINLASKTPPAVPIEKATSPKTNIPIVSNRKNFPQLIYFQPTTPKESSRYL